MLARLASLLAVPALAVALASCGDDDASAPSDLAPTDTALYLEATLESEEQVANAQALIAELGEVPLLGSTLDPEAIVAGALEDSAADAGVDFSYAEDVEPWLGERAAIAFLSFEGFSDPEVPVGNGPIPGEAIPDFVIVLETTDQDIARDSITRIASSSEGASLEETEIAGEPGLSDPEADLYMAFADDFIVLAPEQEAVESALDARGDPLTDADIFGEAQDGLPEERLGFGFVDVAGAVEYAVASGGTSQEEADTIEAFYGEGFDQPASFALTAGERTLAVDVASGLGQLGFPSLGESELTAQAPEDAIAVLGLGDLEAQAQALLDQLGALAESTGDPELDRDLIESGFQAAVGVSLEEALAALGEASLWLRGTPPDDYAVGFQIVTGDPQIAADVLRAAAQGLESDGYRVGPAPRGAEAGFEAALDPLLAAGTELLFVSGALEGDRVTVVLATGRAAAGDSPAGAVGATPGFADAEAALGDDFALTGYADLVPILDLLVEQGSAFDVVTGATAPEQFVLEFLADKLGFAAIGTRADGERVIQRLVAGLE